MDGVLDAGGTIGTMKEIANYIRNGPENVTVTRTVQNDIIYYQHDCEEQDKVLAAAIELDSTYTDHDQGVNLTAGYNGMGIDGEPFSTIEASIGCVQSKTTNFHPEKL